MAEERAATGAWAAEQRGASPGFWRRFAGRLARNTRGRIGLTILFVLLVAGFGAAAVSPYDPLAQTQGLALHGPTWSHLFGVDELGRDLFSRTLYGLRTSLIVSIIAVALGGTIGTVVGLVAGYTEGLFDIVSMRIIDGMLAFPGILLGIALITAFGASARNIGIVVAVFNVPIFARLARGAMLAEKGRDYVVAVRVLGASGKRIVFYQILLNITAPLVVQTALAIAFAVLLDAGLEFLGLGARPPAPSLGSLLSSGQQYLPVAPWYALLPGVVLMLLLVSLNFVADAINEAIGA